MDNHMCLDVIRYMQYEAFVITGIRYNLGGLKIKICFSAV